MYIRSNCEGLSITSNNTLIRKRSWKDGHVSFIPQCMEIYQNVEQQSIYNIII